MWCWCCPPMPSCLTTHDMMESPAVLPLHGRTPLYNYRSCPNLGLDTLGAWGHLYIVFIEPSNWGIFPNHMARLCWVGVYVFCMPNLFVGNLIFSVVHQAPSCTHLSVHKWPSQRPDLRQIQFIAVWDQTETNSGWMDIPWLAVSQSIPTEASCSLCDQTCVCLSSIVLLI